MPRSDIIRRAITIIIGAPIVLVITYTGFPAYDLLVLSVSIICIVEYQSMFPYAKTFRLGVSIALVVALVVGVSATSNEMLAIWVMGLTLIAGILACGLRIIYPSSTLHWVAGLVYIGVPMSLLPIIRHGQHGFVWTLILLINNWSTDGFALIGGRLFGKRKLAPSISPKKTVEGAVIGILCGCLLGMAVGVAGAVSGISNVASNVLIALLTVTGDLFESWMKRKLNVKDTGILLPGHGGFLDRVDGLLFSIPALFIYLSIFVMAP